MASGDISKLTAQLAKKLGRVVLGLTPDDLEKLKLDNIDIIAALGKWKEWSKDQVCSVSCLVYSRIVPSQTLQIKQELFGILAKVAPNVGKIR